jgi:hypothetical protein
MDTMFSKAWSATKIALAAYPLTSLYVLGLVVLAVTLLLKGG